MTGRQFINFLALVAYVFATVGAFGYAVWGGSWPIGIAVIIMAALAFPEVKRRFKEWTEDGDYD